MKLRSWLLKTGLALGLSLTVPLASPSLAQSLPEHADIRLVMDISGSMKRTDPNNLRRPALSLLVRLLPPDSEAGVWTFGEQVNSLVAHDQVDEPWKARALGRVDDINSVALYTHIGAALEAAAYDRDQRSDQSPRADIILLTDGMVDVSPDPSVSAREQVRVAEQLVPELREAGYHIHTIGLSDDADEPLLRQIARGSDGMFSRARNADQLMDSLLQIFQQTVPAEQLPINGGLFLIDDSIEEFTALIRREAGQHETELTDPQGRRYQAETDRPDLRWHHTEEYDLITVSNPVSGRWEINAELQPYSRLTIISNLRLVVAPLPNNINVGEPVEVDFYLHDDNGVVDDAELLELLELTLEMSGSDGTERVRQQWQDDPPEDGRFQMTLPAPRRPGDYELNLNLDGKSFQRLFNHRFAVTSQFEVSLTKRVEEEQVHWDLLVDGKDSVNPEQTSVVAHIRHSGGASAVRNLESERPGIWRYTLTPETRANYRIALQASGQTANGREFEEHLPSQYFTYPEADDPQPDPLGEAIEGLSTELDNQREATERARQGESIQAPESSVTLGEAESVPAPAAAEVAGEGSRATTHPAILALSLLLANGLLLAIAYLGYRMIMGERKRPEMEGEQEEFESEGAGKSPPPMQRIEPELEAIKPAPAPTASPKTPPVAEPGDDEEPLFPLDGDDPLFDDGSDFDNDRNK